MGQTTETGRGVARLRAMAHPVRLRILSLLTAEAMSAADVARALDLTHANASYHLRVLLDSASSSSRARRRSAVASPSATATSWVAATTAQAARRPTTT